jgi:hypothetical protein
MMNNDSRPDLLAAPSPAKRSPSRPISPPAIKRRHLLSSPPPLLKPNYVSPPKDKVSRKGATRKLTADRNESDYATRVSEGKTHSQSKTHARNAMTSLKNAKENKLKLRSPVSETAKQPEKATTKCWDLSYVVKVEQTESQTGEPPLSGRGRIAKWAMVVNSKRNKGKLAWEGIEVDLNTIDSHHDYDRCQVRVVSAKRLFREVLLPEWKMGKMYKCFDGSILRVTIVDDQSEPAKPAEAKIGGICLSSAQPPPPPTAVAALGISSAPKTSLWVPTQAEATNSRIGLGSAQPPAPPAAAAAIPSTPKNAFLRFASLPPPSAAAAPATSSTQKISVLGPGRAEATISGIGLGSAQSLQPLAGAAALEKSSTPKTSVLGPRPPETTTSRKGLNSAQSPPVATAAIALETSRAPHLLVSEPKRTACGSCMKRKLRCDHIVDDPTSSKFSEDANSPAVNGPPSDQSEGTSRRSTPSTSFSVRKKQCSRCKKAQSRSYDPLISCPSCKRSFHESCVDTESR